MSGLNIDNNAAAESAPAAAEAAAETAAETANGAAADAGVAKGPAAEALIKDHVIGAVALAAVPVPLVDIAGVAALQLRMIQKLSELYGRPFSESLGKSAVAALAGGVGGFTAGLVAFSAAKAVPGVGWALSFMSMPVLAGASTYAVGQVFVKHFEDGGSLLDFNIEKHRACFREQLEKGKALAGKVKAEAMARVGKGKAKPPTETGAETGAETGPETAAA